MTDRYDPLVCILGGGSSLYFTFYLYRIGASRETTQLAPSTAVLDNTKPYRLGPGAARGVLPCQRRASCLQRISDLTRELDAEATARQAAETAKEASEARVRGLTDWGSASTMQQSRAHRQQQQDYRYPTGKSLIMPQHSMRVPRFEGKKVHVWPRRFQYFLTARNLISELERTPDPIKMAGGLRFMAEQERSIYRHGLEKVEKCVNAWKFPIEAMQGQPVVERVHKAGSIEEAW